MQAKQAVGCKNFLFDHSDRKFFIVLVLAAKHTVEIGEWVVTALLVLF